MGISHGTNQSVFFTWDLEKSQREVKSVTGGKNGKLKLLDSQYMGQVQLLTSRSIPDSPIFINKTLASCFLYKDIGENVQAVVCQVA